MPSRVPTNTVDRQRAETRDNWREARRCPFDISRPMVLGPAEKRPSSASLETWLRRYFPEVFYLPFSAGHKSAVKTIRNAIEHGGLYGFCMPRGSGKSTLVKGACVWALLTGRKKYVVALAATGWLAAEIMRFVESALMDNERLAKDYPVLSALCKYAEGKAVKADNAMLPDPVTPDAYIPAGMTWRSDRLVLPCVPGAVWSEGAIETDGITASIKGRTITMRDGTPRRPDFAFLDDLSTREAAESATATNRLERLVDGDVLALSGPRVALSAVATCTICAKDDLADRLTDRERNPQWQGMRTATVTSWPARGDLWDEYVVLRRIDILDGTDRAQQHYREHRDEMQRGFRVAWPENHLPGSDAYRDVYNQIVKMGKAAFLAEYQNSPLASSLQPYELTQTQVIAKANGLPRGIFPAATVTSVVMADINHSGVHWAYVGFAGDGSAHIADYGKYPEAHPLYDPQRPARGEEVEIYEGLVRFREHLGAKGYRPDLATIDVGNWLSTVERYIQAQGSLWPCKLLGSKGRANTQYRIPKETLLAKDNCYLSRWKSGVIVVTHNACRLRERMQTSFLLSGGAPGGLTVFGEPMLHSYLAEHVTAEVLESISENRQGLLEYRWATKGANDLCDALTGCYALAEVRGISWVPESTAKANPRAKRRGRGLVQ